MNRYSNVFQWRRHSENTQRSSQHLAPESEQMNVSTALGIWAGIGFFITLVAVSLFVANQYENVSRKVKTIRSRRSIIVFVMGSTMIFNIIPYVRQFLPLNETNISYSPTSTCLYTESLHVPKFKLF